MIFLEFNKITKSGLFFRDSGPDFSTNYPSPKNTQLGANKIVTSSKHTNYLTINSDLRNRQV